MAETSAAAQQIAEAVIQATARAILSDEFEDFHLHQAYPQQLETYEGSKVIEDRDQLEAIFEAVREYQKTLGVDHLQRKVKTATFVDPNHIELVYTTTVFREGKPIGEPYSSFGILRREGEKWLLTYCMYPLVPTDLMHQALLRVPEGRMEHLSEKFTLGAA